MVEKTYQSVIPDDEGESFEGYSPNRRLPRFVGPTEIRRLDKVIEEKNALIEKFKEYDEERKAYYAAFLEEYEAMKEAFDQFMEELRKVFEDGDRELSEYKKILRLYRNWLNYKNNAEHYKHKLFVARESIHEILDDISKLEALLSRVDYNRMSDLEGVNSQLFTIRKHLEAFQGKMNVS